jgi:hypothetical protein
MIRMGLLQRWIKALGKEGEPGSIGTVPPAELLGKTMSYLIDPQSAPGVYSVG